MNGLDIVTNGYWSCQGLSIATDGYWYIDVIIDDNKKIRYLPSEDEFENVKNLTKQHQQLILILRIFLLCKS